MTVQEDVSAVGELCVDLEREALAFFFCGMNPEVFRDFTGKLAQRVFRAAPAMTADHRNQVIYLAPADGVDIPELAEHVHRFGQEFLNGVEGRLRFVSRTSLEDLPLIRLPRPRAAAKA